MKVRFALLSGALLWAVSFGVAGAAFSYEGSDYSYDYNSKSYIATCDQESDSTPVKGEYDFNNSGGSDGNVKDSDGNNGSCASKNTNGVIVRHKTCEYRSFWPDTCGSWVAP